MPKVSRRLLALILLCAYLPVATGCHHNIKVPVSGVTLPLNDEIVGATLKNTAVLSFDGAGALRGDTLFGTIATRPVALPVDSLQTIWLRRSNPGATVGLVVGIAVGALVLASGIALATKESCPFVYSWDGTQYVFDAEPYGGAITRSLARHDYGALEHLAATGGQYRLLVTNEVNESQFTDLLELWAIDHAPGVRVIPDEFGGLHTVAAPQPPIAARDGAGTHLLPWFAATDQLIWQSAPMADSTGGVRDEITLSFARPVGAGTVKLITRVGTGNWGSHMIRVLLGLHGQAVDDWYTGLDENPEAADSVRTWSVTEGLYGLAIEVRGRQGWEPEGVLTGGGPFTTEDRVIVLDISAVAGDTLDLRLRPARGFWAFNSFAVDYSPDTRVRVDTLMAQQVEDPKLGDVTSLLTAADGRYHALSLTGDFAFATFRAPPFRPGLERTILLHSAGYYRLRGLPSGPADTAMVRRVVTEPDAAATLAAEEYARAFAATAAR
jgi:hypothetical protein